MRIQTTKFSFTDSSTVFVEATIPVTILLLTRGGMGAGYGQSFTLAEIKQVRVREFHRSVQALGVRYRIFDFPDLLLEQQIAQAVQRVLPIVRREQFSALFSFHPQSHTLEHSDHRAVGKIALRLWEVSDVRHFVERYPATGIRPALYLLVQDIPPIVTPTHIIEYGGHIQGKRNQHIRIYPSQFLRSTDGFSHWVELFDRVASRVAVWHGRTLPYAEAYRLIE
ncbi:MAG: PIG-L family deacetylase [Candidatus Sungbacteria bacterium]|uniref:PIG-L family deacetylase n=1 Tax=Candidatus Sungiibacteriota bacterium TaxID=2750080 RepID=A0A932YVL5_9BACT|nr:PIG-L family deacetylase [Candidatus Sungbacteria bacterium]